MNTATSPATKTAFRRRLKTGDMLLASSHATIPPEITFSEFRIGDYNMPVTSRVSSVSVHPFQIRAASPQDLDQLCGLASELLANIRAEGTAEDARRVFEHIMNSADLGFIVVAETIGTLCGYAYASYEWRAGVGGGNTDNILLFVSPPSRSKRGGGSPISPPVEKTRQARNRPGCA